MIFGPEFPKSQDRLREGLYELLRRSYERAEEKGQGLAVYRSSFQVLRALAEQPWAQPTIFPAESRLVRQFLAQTKLRPADAGKLVSRSLLLHAAAATWRRTLQRMARAPFLSLCDVSGEEFLKDALAQGRGVMVLHRHTLFASLFWSWLEHAGYVPGVTLGHWAWAPGSRGAREDPKAWVPEVARELMGAAASLRAGGLAHVFADGIVGARPIELEFCNRRRGFRPAFAELALGTNSLMLSAGVDMRADGRLAVRVEAPLADDAALPRAERGARLVREYAARLRERWEEDPAQLPWNDMLNHLRFPALQ